MRTEQITVMASYPAPGSTPRGLAWDGEHLWHADEQFHRLFKLDAHTLHVLESFPIAGEPRGLEWDGHALWLTDNRDRVQELLANGLAERREHSSGVPFLTCSSGGAASIGPGRQWDEDHKQTDTPGKRLPNGRSVRLVEQQPTHCTHHHRNRLMVCESTQPVRHGAGGYERIAPKEQGIKNHQTCPLDGFWTA
jgi:hypothetical protein